ncbi:MAG: ABC transporter substrate-binding protein [Gammaproteobacteria bacterium]|nr:ABC transporter substrate-binding protein [Gammaproteobacteria bacterium]
MTASRYGRRLCGWLAAAVVLTSGAVGKLSAQSPAPSDWPSVVQAAEGQALFFYAWGGDPQINDYLAWVGRRVNELHGVRMTHVRLGDTSDAVSRVLAERQAGTLQDGAVDLLWLNGENFASLKSNDLLFGPWAEQLPNFALVNADDNPDVRFDFTVPVEGYESPWLRAHLVFYYDSAYVEAAPRNVAELLAWARQYPGEFTYPRPPNFLATTFLKQALLELTDDHQPLYRPAGESDFESITAPLWTFLDALHPLLLRQGRTFPANAAELRRLMADGETSLALSFNPAEAVNSVIRNELPDTVRTILPDRGTLANVSFVAIPFNASHKAAAMVTANFLLSVEAQLRALDPRHLGGTPVIDIDSLPSAEQQQFAATRQDHPAAPPLMSDRRQLQEPHPSWMDALEQAWMARYGVR